MEIDYVPPPTGVKFMRSDAPVRMIMGPVGSGKSTVCLMEIFRRCSEMPKCKDGFRRSRWAVIRNTRQQLRLTVVKTWFQWFPDGVCGRWRESDMTYMLEIGEIRAEILFLALDTPDDQRKLLSLELTGAFVNETREVHPEIITALRSRMPRYPSRAQLPQGARYWSGLIMDTNPPNMDSWLHDQFEDVRPEGWELFRQPSGLAANAENKENLGDTYYEDMMSGATEDWIRVHVHGEYGRSMLGKAVYERSFNYDFHVSPEPLTPIAFNRHPVIIGMDFGRTPAAVFKQRDARSRILTLDAVYVENIGLENFVNLHVKPILSSRFPSNRVMVVGDPAGWAKSQLSEENVADVLKRCSLPCRPAPTNDPEKRIEAVERSLSQQVDGKAMAVFAPASTSPGMKYLLQAMNGGYKYKRKTDGSYEVAPAKDKYSHVSDADQYATLGIDFAGEEYQMRDARREVKKVAYHWA